MSKARTLGPMRCYFDLVETVVDSEGVEVADLNEARGLALEAVDAQLAKIVELRYFGGLEHDEIAAVLGVSNATVRRRFRLAKAWLYRRLSGRVTQSGG